jgi:hypothetical protein
MPFVAEDLPDAGTEEGKQTHGFLEQSRPSLEAASDIANKPATAPSVSAGLSNAPSDYNGLVGETNPQV